MTVRDNAYLFDITTRLALYVEGIKLWQMQEFNTVLAAVELELHKLLKRVDYKTLDGLSKAELNRLLLALRKSQFRIYSAYTERLVKTLQEFMRLRLEVSAIVYSSAKHSFDNNGEFVEFDEAGAFEYLEDESKALPFAPLFGLAAILPKGFDSLWSTIKNAPIPANGLYLLPFISTFSRSAQASIENAIRKGWANKQPVEDVLKELSGTQAKQGNSTQFAKIALQANAVIETAFSHVDQIVSQAITSALFSHYGWVSVIDNVTTQVCRERDGNAYRYGAGPIPPAHYRCRSITVPLASLIGDFDPPTLYAWLKKQPADVRRDLLGKEAAALLSSGKLTAKDFAALSVVKALKLIQLKSKLGLILST